MAPTISSLNGTSVFSTTTLLHTQYILSTLCFHFTFEQKATQHPAQQLKPRTSIFLHRRTRVRRNTDQLQFSNCKNQSFSIYFTCSIVLKFFIVDNLDSEHTIQNSFNKWSKISSHEIDIFGLKVVVKSGLGKIILNFTEPLQSCCCPVQKNLPRKAELAWQVSRYL